MRRKLIDIEEEKIEITQFDKDSQIVKTNKLDDITDVVFSLDELDNTKTKKKTKTKTGHLATLYLLITWLPMAILFISNPTLLSIRNLRMESLSL